MIGYVTLGMNNVEAARAYYDELLGSIGASRFLEQGEEANFVTMYATSFEAPRIVITCPFDGGAASPGNGNMVAIERPTRADVDAFYAKALKLGGTSASVFGKLVMRRRGGYRFEQNSPFLRALHSLGFTARPLLARVWLMA